MDGPPPVSPAAPPPSVSPAVSKLQQQTFKKGERHVTIRPEDLAISKRKLKHVNRTDIFEPVTLDKAGLFSNNEGISENRVEFLPLHIARHNLVTVNLTNDLVTINFSGVEMLTDAVFFILSYTNTTFHSLKKLMCSGCLYLTDLGVTWISRMTPQLKMAELEGCAKVTEKGLYALVKNCQQLQNLSIVATDVSRIPKEIEKTTVAQGSFRTQGAPVISSNFYLPEKPSKDSNKSDATEKKARGKVEEIGIFKLVVLRDESMTKTLKDMVNKNEETMKTLPSVLVWKSCQPMISAVESLDITFHVTEVAALSTLQDTVVSPGSIVMVMYTVPDSGNSQNIGHRLAETIGTIVAKFPDVVVITLGLTNADKENSSLAVHEAIIRRLTHWSKAVSYDVEFIVRKSWHMENIDFSGQLSLAAMGQMHEKLKELIQTEKELLIMLSSMQSNIEVALATCLAAAVKSAKTNFPWIHLPVDGTCFQLMDLFPKKPLMSLHQEYHSMKKNEKQQFHTRQPYPHMRKIMDLMAQCGRALYLPGSSDDLCVTDLHKYCKLICDFLEAKPPVSANISCFGGLTSFWDKAAVAEFLKKHSSDMEGQHFVKLITKQALILPIRWTANQKHPTVREEANSQDMSPENKFAEMVYIRIEDLPKSHPALEQLWPDKAPQNTHHASLFYTVLPGLPPSVLISIFRHIVKVISPMLVWRTGLLLRQGPVDVLVQLWYNNNRQSETHDEVSSRSNFQGSPVLVISGRLAMLPSETVNSTTKSNCNKCLWGVLQTVSVIADYVFRKHNISTHVTVPCKQCCDSNLKMALQRESVFHFAYYVTLSSSKQGPKCKVHNEKVNIEEICGPQYPTIVPFHNYAYLQAANRRIDQLKTEGHFRPADATPPCFLCCDSMHLLCHHCQICFRCIQYLAKYEAFIRPGFVQSSDVIKHGAQSEPMADPHAVATQIQTTVTGPLLNMKKGQSVTLSKPMTPVYFDKASVSILRGFNYTVRGDLPNGQYFEFQGPTGTFLDSQGNSKTDGSLKCRLGSVLVITMQFSQLPGKSDVSFYMNGLKVISETVDGWEIQLTIIKTVSGLTAVFMPGLKKIWQQSGTSHFAAGNTMEVLSRDNSSLLLPAMVSVEDQWKFQFIVSSTGEKINFNSKRIRPSGYAEIKQREMAGNDSDLESPPFANKTPLALWKFRQPHVIDCLEELLMIIKEAYELIPVCTEVPFPAVLFAEMENKKDWLEENLFQKGQVDYSGTAVVLLPSDLSAGDLISIPLNRLTSDLHAHPLCYVRGDINSVMSVQPTHELPVEVECFRIVHLLNNTGFAFPIESEICSRPLIWAWALMLLHLQKEGLKNYGCLVKNISKEENLSNDQIWQGLRQVITLMTFLLYLSFKGQQEEYCFQNHDTIKEFAGLLKSKLRNQMGEDLTSQGLEVRTMAFTSDELLMCAGHASTWQAGQGLTEVSKPFLTEYPQFIYSLMLSSNQLRAIAGAVFTCLYNLKDLDLSDNLLQVLPEEIGKCHLLESLGLDKNCLTTLPDSLGNCRIMRRLDISRNHFTKFPKVVTKLTSLLRLYAQHLQLTILPDDIGCLTKLERLYLNGNCFSSLPSSITKLQKLQDLSLNGVPWCKVRANQLLSKEHFEAMLTEQNLSRWLKANNQSKGAIFQLFDEDTNGTLDAKEIGKLNATIFTIFPRFGYMNSEPPYDDTPCGFPEEILSLENLEYLSLQYQGIVSVPDGIRRLCKLTVLNVSHNPNLLSVSAEAGNLPLKRLEMEECPLLKTPPKEIRAKGFFSCHAYLKRLLSGSVDCKRTKLMLVGLGGAGKTSLVKALTSDTDKADMAVGEEITDGIDICPWTVRTEETPLKFSVWDFAGQTVYYNTHQFFLSDRAVYLLLWNVRLGHEHAGLDFWLSSISVHAPKAPIFVVGTHVDQVSKVELPMKEMQKRYNQIVGFFFVSSFSGQGIKNLKETIIQTTLQQQYMGEKIPGVWLSFEENLKRIADRSVIPYSELEKIANQSGIFEKSEVVQAVQFLHELGSLQHFTKDFLKDQVVINPQWIVDVMACVVSVKDSAIKNGQLKHEDVGVVWKGYPDHLHSWLLRLTEEYDLTFPLKDKKVNLVPCLLTEKEPEFDWPEIEKGSEVRETKMVYKFDYLPAGLFNRGQVRLHEFSDGSQIWKRGSYLHKNGHLCLVRQSRDSELLVQAQGPRPENILFLVHEVYEGLILESFQGVTYDYLIPCPECLKLILKDPHMFPATTVRRAVELKAPFLQCLKYFHIISIVDLQAAMPPDSSTDFDLHLVQGVRGLKELHHDLAADIFVSFCNKDEVSEKPGAIFPSRVLKDIEKMGYKSWVAGKGSSVDEMVKALMDARLFLVFMTNAYSSDEDCCNLFKYARLTLKKPMLLVALGTGFEWQQSRLGILLADEVYVNMQQAERYEVKLEELKDRLNDQVTQKMGIEKKDFPSCFISYCWQNSARAVAKGSRTIEGAIGHGDPRDIKDYLESKGIKCWIDVERVGAHGLFEDIGEGLIKAKVVIACISDQYAASSNCAVEFRYAVNTLRLPVMLAVVGTGSSWRATEVGTLSQNYPMVSFQEQQSQIVFERLVNLVQPYLAVPDAESEQMKVAKASQDQQSLSFQELSELIQRKFLRQLAVYAEIQDSITYPRLFLIDFIKSPMESAETSGGDATEGTERNKKQETPRVDFREQSYCAYILCEHDEGWHVSGVPVKLPTLFGTTLEKYAPFMARITAITRYSKKMVMNCMATECGQQLLQWLEKSPQIAEHSDFQDSYHALRQTIAEADETHEMGNTARCHLPNGRMVWLCERHRKTMKVTILSEADTVSSTIHTTESVFVDYMIQALREMNNTDMFKHEPYSESSTRKPPKLPHGQQETAASEVPSSPSIASTTAKDVSSAAVSHPMESSASSRLSLPQGSAGPAMSLNRQVSQLTFSGVKSTACVLI